MSVVPSATVALLTTKGANSTRGGGRDARDAGQMPEPRGESVRPLGNVNPPGGLLLAAYVALDVYPPRVLFLEAEPEHVVGDREFG